MDAHFRRAAALDAIERIRRGERPDTLESDTLDFKEETGTVGRDGARTPIPPEHEPAARALAAEAACFANAEGGVLVVGVDDKRSGPAAFVGAYLDAIWLRERIHALTLPHLSVDRIEELVVEGKRLYLVNVADALEEIRCDGKLRARVGRGCEELTGDQARQLLERRRRYDWSAEPSGLRLSRAEPAALAVAHRLYRQEHGRTPPDDAALASQLGLTIDDGDDARLNNAGAALLCALEPDRVQINLRATRSPGAVAYERLASRAPLLTALDEAFAALDRLFVPRHTVVGLLRRERRAIPRRAYREALVNAVMHRDHRQINSQVEVTVVGDPAATLSVRSPGTFPPGVSASHLLSVPSRPRNPALAHALHTLGLAEREGVGVDTMYVEMLRDGHAEPEIVETGGDVLCNLFGGTPNEDVRSFF